MSRSVPMVSGLVLVFALSASAQEATRAAPKPRGDAKVARLVYAIREGSAKDLANALVAHFKAEESFEAFPDPASNTLLLSGPEKTLDEALAVLRQIDRPARPVHVEVFLLQPKEGGEGEKGLERSELSGPAGDVRAKVRDLQRRGVLAGVKRLQLTTLQGRPAVVKDLQSKPYVMGVTAAPFAGGVSRSVTYHETGTAVTVRPEVGADGVVTLDLHVEDSRARAPEGGASVGTDEKGAAIPAAEFVTTSLESQVKVRPGHAVLAEGMTNSSKTGEGMLVIVSVSGEETQRDGK